MRRAANERRQEKFTALLHHLSVDLLRESFYALQRKAAPGVDGGTWREYETGLEGRLVDLDRRVHRGAYRAQPSRRVYIQKSDGRQRRLGIAALEDKAVQQAVVTIFNQIHEVDFQGFSYGFRPGRSSHQALDALTVGIQTKRVRWVLDCDIQGFFDNLSHDWLVKFIKHRVADPRMLRLIQKWLRAGVSEDGQWSETTLPRGSGQLGSAGVVPTPAARTVEKHLVSSQSEGAQVLVCRLSWKWNGSVPGNSDRLALFQHRLRVLLRNILFRRSQKGRKSWKKLNRPLDRWIPFPRVLHPYPMERFCATHPR